MPLDPAEAYFWLNLAATMNSDGRDRTYEARRDKVAAQLPPAVRAAVQERCREWIDAFAERGACR